MKRQSTVKDRAASNDSLRRILVREAKKMRRRASNRSRTNMKHAYRDAADLIAGIIPSKQ